MAYKSQSARSRRQAAATASLPPPPDLLPRHFVLPLRLGVVVLFLLVLRFAWMSDDAFITLRTVDNFWQGWGLRWNILERVQSYTHPLWMMLLAAGYGITREPYYMTIAISTLCLAGMVALIVRRLDPPRAFVVILALIGSRAFVDFSTSGLENPLSHLLLAAFCLTWMAQGMTQGTTQAMAQGMAQGMANGVSHETADDAAADQSPSLRRYRVMAWLTAACILTRMELVLLVGPAMLVETWRLGWRRAVPAAAPAALAVGAWHLFTLVYYGSLVPNTALAKLSPGVPRSMFLGQGLAYLWDSLRYDFVTLPLILAGLVAAWRDRRVRPMAIGIGLMLAFVIWVGGDFMSGRFLTPALICAVLMLARRVPTPRAALAVSAAVLLLAAIAPRTTLAFWQPDRIYGWVRELTRPSEHGIVDERRVYQMDTGLVHVLFGGHTPARHDWARMAATGNFVPTVRVHGAVGMLGFYGGPGSHIIDDMALNDPFLSRLPPEIKRFRPGHFVRVPPPGYVESMTACFKYVMPHGSLETDGRTCLDVEDQINLMKNPTLRQMLSDVMRVTQAPLFEGRRWQAIWRLRPLSAMPPSGP